MLMLAGLGSLAELLSCCVWAAKNWLGGLVLVFFFFFHKPQACGLNDSSKFGMCSLFALQGCAPLSLPLLIGAMVEALVFVCFFFIN